MIPPHAVSMTNPADMEKSRAWMGQFFTSFTTLPISFVLDEKPIAGIPAAWQPVSHHRQIDANITETVYEGRDPGSGLHVRVEQLTYHDYPVVEWVAWFANQGHVDTPILRDILVMDGAISGSSSLLYHCNGDFYSAGGYTPSETPLPVGATVSFAPNGGRPCDGAFPYYRLMFEDGGLTIAIGWPAQWTASFNGIADGVHLRAGQEKTKLRLVLSKEF